MTIRLDTAIFANAEKDEPVDGALDRKVEFMDRQCGIAERQVLGERLAPGFDLFQEFRIDGCGTTLAIGDGVLVEGAFEHRLLGEDGGDLVPFGQIVSIGEIENAPCTGFVGRVRACAAIVDGELLEIRQGRARKLGRPSIAATLMDRPALVLYINGRFRGFVANLPAAASAGTGVGGFGGGRVGGIRGGGWGRSALLVAGLGRRRRWRAGRLEMGGNRP